MIAADAGRMQLADAAVQSMRNFTSNCNSVKAVATAELLKLLQLRRLPPSFISHCMRRLDPTDCGFINSNAVRDFLCACSLVRAGGQGVEQKRVQMIERSVYSGWLKCIQVSFLAFQPIHDLTLWVSE